MKTLKKLLCASLALALLISLPSCAHLGTADVSANTGAAIVSTLPYLRTSSALAATGVLIAAKPADRVNIANYLNAAALGIETLSGSSTPTPDQVKTVIGTFTKGSPNAASYESLAVSLSSLYASIFPKLQGNAAATQQALNLLALGCQDASAPYLAPSTPAPSTTPASAHVKQKVTFRTPTSRVVLKE